MSSQLKKAQVFAGVSCTNNPGPGGWCALSRSEGYEKEISGGEKNTTNNRMEIRAAIEGIKAVTEPSEIALYTGSYYVANAINEFIDVKWKKTNFAKVKNPDLWREYLAAAAPHKVTAYWVRGFDRRPENDQCEARARSEAAQYKK